MFSIVFRNDPQSGELYNSDLQIQVGSLQIA